MKAILTKFLTAVFLIVTIFSPGTLAAADPRYEAQPPPPAQPGPGEDLGYGVGAVLASILYSPLKVTYAGLGLVTGGVGWVLSAGNPDVANNIIYPAVKGDYIIKPNHLKGTEPVIFIGPPPNRGAPQMGMASEPPRP